MTGLRTRISLRRTPQAFGWAVLALFASGPATSVWACATCSGKSDAAMALGMNAGILLLIGVIGCVLAGISSFFVFLGRRSAAFSENESPTGEGRPVHD